MVFLFWIVLVQELSRNHGNGIMSLLHSSPLGNLIFILMEIWLLRNLSVVGWPSLPLTLLNLYVNLSSNKYVILNWQTAQEINTSHFIIERSANGTDFSSIGKVSASGNNSITKDYLYTDTKPAKGTNYYRLKMVDADGIFT
jgi:hypothetical protein